MTCNEGSRIPLSHFERMASKNSLSQFAIQKEQSRKHSGSCFREQYRVPFNQSARYVRVPFTSSFRRCRSWADQKRPGRFVSISNKNESGKTYLERVVDTPLQGGKGTNHDDTGAETTPEASETDFGVDRADGRLGLSSLERSVQLGNHGIGRVRDDGAEDTGNVTSDGRDTELSRLAKVILCLAEVFVDLSDGSFERPELHHCVRNLTTPKRRQRLVQSANGTVNFRNQS